MVLALKGNIVRISCVTLSIICRRQPSPLEDDDGVHDDDHTQANYIIQHQSNLTDEDVCMFVPVVRVVLVGNKGNKEKVDKVEMY